MASAPEESLSKKSMRTGSARRADPFARHPLLLHCGISVFCNVAEVPWCGVAAGGQTIRKKGSGSVPSESHAAPFRVDLIAADSGCTRHKESGCGPHTPLALQEVPDVQARQAAPPVPHATSDCPEAHPDAVQQPLQFCALHPPHVAARVVGSKAHWIHAPVTAKAPLTHVSASAPLNAHVVDPGRAHASPLFARL